MKLYTLLFLSLLTALTSCNGQNASQINGSNSNNKNPTIAIGDSVPGLSESIMVIYQDKANNYWFGSRGKGVYRYDGKNFLQFTMIDGLVSNDIWGIQEDKSGNIYFDTQDGVSKFDGKTISTLTVSDKSDNEWKLEPDDLWFKGSWNINGPYRYDGNYLHHLQFPKNDLADSLYANFPNMTWSPYGIYSLYKDKKGNIWFGTSNLGIYRYDGKKISWMFEDHLTNPAAGGSFGIRSIFEDHEGKFWFCNTRYRFNIESKDSTSNGKSLIRYTREKGIDQKAADGDWIYFMSITEDNMQNLWMLTYGEGVWRYDGKNMIRYPVLDGSKEITLFSIYKDNSGSIWLGTHEAGAYKFNGKTFEKFIPKL